MHLKGYGTSLKCIMGTRFHCGREKISGTKEKYLLGLSHPKGCSKAKFMEIYLDIHKMTQNYSIKVF